MKSHTSFDGNYDAKSNAQFDVKTIMHSNMTSGMKSDVDSFFGER